MIKIFITGPPGVGKTTCVYRVYEMLKLYNYNVGGFITKEIRKNGRRYGFKLIDLDTGYESWLANVEEKSSYTIGRYYVFVDKFEKFIEEKLSNTDKYDIIIIDEIGPMEMLSRKFRFFVSNTLSAPIPSVYTVHHKIANRLKKEFKTEYENILYMITRENREGMPLIIWNKLSKYLKEDENL